MSHSGRAGEFLSTILAEGAEHTDAAGLIDKPRAVLETARQMGGEDGAVVNYSRHQT